jgi:transposase
VLYTRTRQVRNRLSIALRLGAHALHHADNYLGEFFRRLKRKLGKPEAATAHKLALIVFHLLTTREEYDESVFIKHEQETAAHAEARLRKQAAKLGFQVIPAITG